MVKIQRIERNLSIKYFTKVANIYSLVKTPPPVVPPSVNCDWKPCKKYDDYNRLWEAYPGVVAIKPCPHKNDAGKISSWECLPNGQFDGNSPNYTQCSSKWLEDLFDDVHSGFFLVKLIS